MIGSQLDTEFSCEIALSADEIEITIADRDLWLATGQFDLVFCSNKLETLWETRQRKQRIYRYCARDDNA